MFAGGKNTAFVISFPDLLPVEASILAKELLQELTLDAGAADQITLARARDDAQDLGSILFIAAGSGLGAGLIELAKDLGKEFVKGAFHRGGQKALDTLWHTLRKWGTRARVEDASGSVLVLGEEYSRPAAPRSFADAETLAELKTLGLVILGASTFPHYPAGRKLDNLAFKRSADLAKKVLSPAHTVFRKVEVLDLFDQDLRPDDVVDRIEDHVEKHPEMHDVLLYYCGHGDLLADREHTYYLVLKGTKPGREVTTGLGIKQFRTMIEAKGVLTRKRCTFVVDCCFAGEAVGAWQSTGLNTLIEKQIRDVLPTRGFAFLTASDKNLRAWGTGGYEGATMFTGALAEVLTAGLPSVRRLSLGDLCAAMTERIRERHCDWKEAVIPQCHAPHQPDGDISRIPMFLAESSGLARTTKFCSGDVQIPRLPRRSRFFERLFASRNESRAASQGAPVSAPAETAAVLQIAGREWAKIEQSSDIEALKIFAEHFPVHYGALALKRISLLQKAAEQVETSLKPLQSPNKDAAPAVVSTKVEPDPEPVHAAAPQVEAASQANALVCASFEDLAARAKARVEAFTTRAESDAALRKKLDCVEVPLLKGSKAQSLGLKAGESFRDLDAAPEMVVIPAGSFMMGTTRGEGFDTELPQHEVTIPNAFAVGKYPVTFAEWDAAVAAGGVSYKPGDEGWGRGQRPVVNVSWNDAQAYVSWLSTKTAQPYRLLSEAEWEYACRAGSKSSYCFADGEVRLSDYAWYSSNSGRGTKPVGGKKPNAFNLQDMHGNVWEWCEDLWHNSYYGKPETLNGAGAAWTTGADRYRVFRGGSWSLRSGRPARCVSRLEPRGHPEPPRWIPGCQDANSLIFAASSLGDSGCNGDRKSGLLGHGFELDPRKTGTLPKGRPLGITLDQAVDSNTFGLPRRCGASPNPDWQRLRRLQRSSSFVGET